MNGMFFENWYEFWRIFLSCLIAYAAFVFWLRISDKRTLSKWNAFDFIVTIALGSILATTVLSKSTLILEGVFAAFLLIAFQYIITFLASRVKFFDRIVKAEPTLLFFKGHFQKNSMKEQRVAKSEILSAIRASGIGSLEKVAAVILETDGTFSVIEKSNAGDLDTALEDVIGYEKVKEKQKSQTLKQVGNFK